MILLKGVDLVIYWQSISRNIAGISKDTNYSISSI